MRRLSLIILVVFGTACDQAGVAPSVALRDSAGVRLVEQGPLDALPVLVVSPEPVFTVGWAEAGVTFGAIPAGALLSDGSAVAFDDGAKVLYRISASGDDVRRVGRAGEGPGEFQDAASVTVFPGDTVVVYDRALGRLSRFDGDGDFVSSGSWARQGMVFSRPAGMAGPAALAWIPESYAVRRDQEGDVLVTGPLIRSGALGEMPDTVAIVTMLEIEYQGGRPVRNPFMAFGMGAGYRDGFVWTRNEAAEIRWLSGEGVVEQISRWRASPTMVDDEVWRRYEEAYRARTASRATRPTEEQLATQLRNARDAAPETLPYFTFSFVTRDGDVWISEYSMMGGPSDRFVRFGADGVAYQAVVFPGPVRILDVRDGKVLGVMTDEWDVEAVVVFEVDP